jgi:putative transposase
MLLCRKIKIEVSEQDAATLEGMQDKCRGLYSFVQMLTYKCLRFGKELSIIDERDTTRMCHACKHTQDMPLWKRTYRCENENCGLVMDRDENSAVNIFQRFVAGLPPHT